MADDEKDDDFTRPQPTRQHVGRRPHIEGSWPVVKTLIVADDEGNDYVEFRTDGLSYRVRVGQVFP